jgi:hypothetical protein
VSSTDTRHLDLSLTITPVGSHGLLRATSDQMPNLIVTGVGNDDLFECLGPVIESLFAAQGERVSSLSVDRVRNRVRLEVLATT